VPFLGEKKPKIDFFHAPKKNLGVEKIHAQKNPELEKIHAPKKSPKRSHGKKTFGNLTLLIFFGGMEKMITI